MVAATTSTLMIAQQIASKSLRDAFFLVHYPVSALPILMIGAAVLSFAMALAMGRVMRRVAPARFVPALFVLSGVLYLLEWIASGALPQWVAIVVYAHTVTFGASVVSGFWSVINERFDPYIAKRVIGTIGAGATLGGLIGGVAVWQGAAFVPIEALLVGLAAVNVLCGALLYQVSGSQSRTPTKTARTTTETSSQSLVSTLQETPYLRHIGFFVLLSALGTSLFDYVFKAQASVRYADGDELVGFFALFYTLVGVATFVVQNTLVRTALVRLGLAPTIGVLPGFVFLFGLGSVVFPGFYAVTTLRAFAATAENSFHRSAYELLYTPLSPEQKRSTKLLIDVGADRAGTALGSGIALVCLAWLATGAETVMLALAALIALCILGALYRLNRGYVHALATSMRQGAVQLEATPGDPAVDEETARRALARTMADFDLSELASSDSGVKRRSLSTPSSALSGVNAEQLRELVLARSRERAAVSAQSPRKESPHHPPATDTTESLDDLLNRLDRSTANDEVERAVRGNAPRMVGRLIDALLSPRLSRGARVRIATILADVPTRRASFGLQLGLDDPEFAVAHASAVALYRMCGTAPSLAPDSSAVFAVVLRELRRTAPSRWSYDWPSDVLESPFFAMSRGNVSVALVHVFTVLGLHCDREPLALAFRSLLSDETSVRGTALEYLENVLPTDVRRALWGHVDVGSALKRPLPMVPSMASELGLALRRREISLTELRRTYRERSDVEVREKPEY